MAPLFTACGNILLLSPLGEETSKLGPFGTFYGDRERLRSSPDSDMVGR